MKMTQRLHVEQIPVRWAANSQFVRSILTSLMSTIIDFISSLILVAIGLYYVQATTLGGLFGAAFSFYLSRFWVFEKRQGKIGMQVSKFIFTNFFSIMLNTSGVFFLIEHFNISFIYSRILIATLIGIFFNYFLYRYFVFRK